MADRVLFIGWGTPVRGREERALEVFNDALGLCGRMEQDGRIEKFEVRLLTPNGQLNGYIELHGSADQLAAVRQDEEFLRNTADASLCVDNLRHVDGYADAGVNQMMELFQQRIAEVPQTA